MTTTTSFHVSNYGAFGKGLPVDQNGYVHTTAAGWMSAPMDWGPDGDDPEYKAERCEELASEAIAAVLVADAKLAEWQASN